MFHAEDIQSITYYCAGVSNYDVVRFGFIDFSERAIEAMTSSEYSTFSSKATDSKYHHMHNYNEHFCEGSTLKRRKLNEILYKNVLKASLDHVQIKLTTNSFSNKTNQQGF